MQDLLLQLEHADGLFTVDPGRTQKSNVRDSHQSHQRPADSSTDGRWALGAGRWLLLGAVGLLLGAVGPGTVHCALCAHRIECVYLTARLQTGLATQAVSIQT